MIKRELSQNPELKDENWDRFLPKFKKQNAKRKKTKIKEKKEFSPFPPEQQLRKEDYQMFSGEYFLTSKQKEDIKNQEKIKKREIKKKEKKEEQAKLYIAPEEPIKNSIKPVFEEKKPDLKELKKKFIKKKK